MLSGKASRVTARAPGVHDWVKTAGVDVWFCPTCGLHVAVDWGNILDWNILNPQAPCTEIPARREIMIDGRRVIVEGPPS